MLCQTKAIEDYTNSLQSGHSQENKILKAMQCYVEQGILPCFWALCMGFLFRLVFMQLRMAQCVDQLIRLPLWVYRSLDQRLIHGYTKVLYVWKPGFVEIIVEIISANYRILRRVRPVRSLSLIIRKNCTESGSDFLLLQTATKINRLLLLLASTR